MSDEKKVEPEHEPAILEDGDEPLDWDLDERDAWLAEHGEDDTPPEGEVVLVEADE